MNIIKINTEFITLVQLLKMESIISSGGEVKYFLEENEVLLNNQAVFEKRKKIYPNDILVINNEEYKIKSEENKKF